PRRTMLLDNHHLIFTPYTTLHHHRRGRPRLPPLLHHYALHDRDGPFPSHLPHFDAATPGAPAPRRAASRGALPLLDHHAVDFGAGAAHVPAHQGVEEPEEEQEAGDGAEHDADYGAGGLRRVDAAVVGGDDGRCLASYEGE